MNFYHQLDAIMKQDMGGRGLLASLPENPIKKAAESLRHAARVILLTGFPVRMEDGGCIGETDGPSGTANLAFAFTQAGAQVLVVTDRASYHLLEEALSYRAPKAALSMIPEDASGDFIRDCIRSFRPTHFISLERPGKALDGHYHNMRGETIDDRSPTLPCSCPRPAPSGQRPSPSVTAAMKWAWAPTAMRSRPMFPAES